MHKVTMIMLKAMIINLFLSLLQVVTGIIGNSSAVTADGIQTLTDFGTDLVAIIGEMFSHQRANNKHPYGYGQIEYLTSIFIGTVVLSTGFILIYNAMNKELVVPNAMLIIVIIFVLISKLLLSQYVLKMGYKHNDSILIASGKESHADVVSSVFVLVSALLAQLTKYNHIFIYADRLAAVMVGILIIKIGYGIMAENISGIIGEQETDKKIHDDLKKVILKEKDIKKVHNIILLKYGPYYKLVTTIIMDDKMTLKNIYPIKRRLIKSLKRYNRKIHYITIDIKSD